MTSAMHRIAALALLAAGLAQAQPVWRCGPEGRSYGDAPCADGRAVEVADARSAEQLQAARQVAARDRSLAAELAQSHPDRQGHAAGAVSAPGAIRLAAPAAAAARTATGAPGARERRATATKPSTRKPRPPADAGTFRATAPSSRRAKG